MLTPFFCSRGNRLLRAAALKDSFAKDINACPRCPTKHYPEHREILRSSAEAWQEDMRWHALATPVFNTDKHISWGWNCLIHKGKHWGREAAPAFPGLLSIFEDEAEMLSRNLYLRLRSREGWWCCGEKDWEGAKGCGARNPYTLRNWEAITFYSWKER